MIVNNFHMRRPRRAIGPCETNAPLIVNPDAVLPLAIAMQRFKSVARKGSEIPERSGCLEAIQLETGGSLETGECLDAFTGRESAGALVPVTDDHRSSIS
jgi:hypothetical protein